MHTQTCKWMEPKQKYIETHRLGSSGVSWCLERSLQCFRPQLAVDVWLVAGRLQCKECRSLCVTEEIYGLPLKPKPALPQSPSYRNCSDTWWWFHLKSLKQNKTKQKQNDNSGELCSRQVACISILTSCSSISPKRSIGLPVSLSNPSVNWCHNREAVAASFLQMKSGGRPG